MKYIRTKYGKILENNWCSVYDAPASLYNNIEKLANTIEELCDFIIFKEDGKTRIRNIDQRFANYQLKTVVFEFPNENIKLAIETDKGIIFVAEKKGILPNGEIDWELL